MIRYEIRTKPGLVLDASLVEKIVTAKPKQHPTIMVYVARNNQQAFEKQIEGDSQVLGYMCDPRAPGMITRDWKRP
jgi:hypothetical protein